MSRESEDEKGHFGFGINLQDTEPEALVFMGYDTTYWRSTMVNQCA